MFVDGTLTQVREQLNLFTVPSFMATAVDDGENFRFLGTNAAHQQASGMKTSAVLNLTPQDLLPPEQADAVLHRYRTCYVEQRSISYDEVLEMPNGKFVWNTSLVPVMSAVENRCVGVFGSAVVAQILEQNQDMVAFQEISHLAEEARIKLSRVKSVVQLLQSGGLRRDDVLNAADFIGNVSTAIDAALVSMRRTSSTAIQAGEQTSYLMSSAAGETPSELSVQQALNALTLIHDAEEAQEAAE